MFSIPKTFSTSSRNNKADALVYNKGSINIGGRVILNFSFADDIA